MSMALKASLKNEDPEMMGRGMTDVTHTGNPRHLFIKLHVTFLNSGLTASDERCFHCGSMPIDGSEDASISILSCNHVQ